MSRKNPKDRSGKRHVRKVLRVPIIFGLGQDDDRQLQLSPHAALLKLREGTATATDYDSIACRINIGQAVTHQCSYNDEVKAVIATAMAAVISVGERHRQLGKFGISGDELVALGAGLNMADELQKSCTRRELREAMLHVFKVAAVDGLEEVGMPVFSEAKAA